MKKLHDRPFTHTEWKLVGNLFLNSQYRGNLIILVFLRLIVGSRSVAWMCRPERLDADQRDGGGSDEVTSVH